MTKIFGKLASGNRLQHILQSPNYKNGSFQNLVETLMVMNPRVMYNTMQQSAKTKDKYPPYPLPVIKTDLHNLSSDVPTVVWFGHSSYLIKFQGKTILVDPVFTNASPIPRTVGAFKHEIRYTVDDMPDIDILVLTHDHYDHLDYRSVVKLKDRVKNVVTGLGTGSHLIYWGFDEKIVTELDWYDQTEVLGFNFTALPSRHFSGRGLKRNQSLWCSYALQLPGYKLYLGGDSGYGTHFKKIGEEFGPFDLAILECGQYNINWHAIHMFPEETVQASIDLKAKVLLPVHWGKFRLSVHAWNESPTRATAAAKQLGASITTPMLGEPIEVGRYYPAKEWWAEQQ